MTRWSCRSGNRTAPDAGRRRIARCELVAERPLAARGLPAADQWVFVRVPGDTPGRRSVPHRPAVLERAGPPRRSRSSRAGAARHTVRPDERPHVPAALIRVSASRGLRWRGLAQARAQTRAATVAAAKPIAPPGATHPPAPCETAAGAGAGDRRDREPAAGRRPSHGSCRRADPASQPIPRTSPRRAVPPGTIAVVTSAASGKVSAARGLRRSARRSRSSAGFDAPHIVELAPCPTDSYAYVTDDARGTLTVIDLRTRRVTSTIHMGAGAHHMGFDLHPPGWRGSRSASRAPAIVILGTARTSTHPNVLGRFATAGFEVHDLAFSPEADGPEDLITASNRATSRCSTGSTSRCLFRVPVGAAAAARGAERTATAT